MLDLPEIDDSNIIINIVNFNTTETTIGLETPSLSVSHAKNSSNNIHNQDLSNSNFINLNYEIEKTKFFLLNLENQA